MELRFTGEIGEFLVEQGKKFSISFECVDADGKVASLGKFQPYILMHTYSDTIHKKLWYHNFVESGRSFEVAAAVRKNVTPRASRSKSRLHQMNSQLLPDLPEVEVPL